MTDIERLRAIKKLQLDLHKATVEAGDEIERLKANLVDTEQQMNDTALGNVKKQQEIERLRHELEAMERQTVDVVFHFNETERLQHMQANLHGHIKRLENENSALHREMAIIETSRDAWRAENVRLREALEKISNRPLDGHIHTIARAALQKERVICDHAWHPLETGEYVCPKCGEKNPVAALSQKDEGQ